MCSAGKDVQCERGCAVRRRIFIIRGDVRYNSNKEVQYEPGTSSLQMRVCSTSGAHTEVLEQGAPVKGTFEYMITVTHISTYSG